MAHLLDPEAGPRNVQLNVRVSESEKRLIARLAREHGLGINAFVRAALTGAIDSATPIPACSLDADADESAPAG